MSAERSPGEQAVLDWLRTHHMPDKDAVQPLQEIPSRKRIEPRRHTRNPSAWDFPLPDLEVDLHNHTVD